MKKIALISAVLFFIVYFLVNFFLPDEDRETGVYPATSATHSDAEAVLDRIMEAGAPADVSTGAPSNPKMRPPSDTKTGAPSDPKMRPPSDIETGAPAEKDKGLVTGKNPGSMAEEADWYYLIVGSFTDYDQAKRVAGEYADKFPAKFIILPPTTEGYYRISCGKYSTAEAASAKLPSVRDEINSGTWICSIKKPL